MHSLQLGTHVPKANLVHAGQKRQCSHTLSLPKSILTPSRSLNPVTRSVPLPVSASSLEGELSDGEYYVEEFEGFREKDRGYTPFEFIEFTKIPLKHEVSVWIDRPIEDCYKVWDNRLNWMQWFDMIDEVGFHEEEPSYISMYLWYRWATTPFLELYVTLERTQSEPNKYILEEPVEGLPLVAAVLFQEGDQDEGTSTGGTTVTLRLSYLLPRILHEFAGKLAVYGDVDRKLQKSMTRMKGFVEGADLGALEQLRKENEEQIRANFAEQRVLKSDVARKMEERAQRWEAEAAAAAAVAEAPIAAPASEVVEEEEGLVDIEALESEVEKKGTKTTHTDPAGTMGNPAGKRRRSKKAAAAAEDA